MNMRCYDDNLFQLLKKYICDEGGNPNTAIIAFTQMGWNEDSVKACIADVISVSKAKVQATINFIMNYELFDMIQSAIAKCNASDSADMNRMGADLNGVCKVFNANDIFMQKKNASYGQIYPESAEDYICKCYAIAKIMGLLNDCPLCGNCPELKLLFDKCCFMTCDPTWEYKNKIVTFFDKYKNKRFDDGFVKKFKNVLLSADAQNEYKKVLDIYSFIPECMKELQDLINPNASEKAKTATVNENANNLISRRNNVSRHCENIVVISEKANNKIYFGLFGKTMSIDENFDIKFANTPSDFSKRAKNMDSLFMFTNEGLVSYGFNGKVTFSKEGEVMRANGVALKENVNPYWDLLRAGISTTNANVFNALNDIVANKASLAILPVIFTECAEANVRCALVKESCTCIVDNRYSGEVNIIKKGNMSDLVDCMYENYGINLYQFVKNEVCANNATFKLVENCRANILKAKEAISALKETKKGVADKADLCAKIDECIRIWNNVILENEEEISNVGGDITYVVKYKLRGENVAKEENYSCNAFTTPDMVIDKYNLKRPEVEWYEVRNAALKPNETPVDKAITNAKTAETKVNTDAKPIEKSVVKENVTYEVEIKEKNNPYVIKTTYEGKDGTTEQEVIAWFGLEEDDVESFTITNL